ncbi:amidohydrolase [Kineosporia sp. NBRC 101677]|uniref:amidohydrolase n=1 Tax=Kineosporia sp. NBRC 101677 TaxID=3032197 RepID=UPI0024A2B146|nr:amidohydrolase [Kineosporia sp. NBRC 101677]GLY19814.1 amidohydrolase [Kineosporia sp. NBRC 101677]
MPAADLILIARHVHTLDPARPAAQAVAISGGTITAVGDRDDVSAWRGNHTEVLDLGAATLTPGLVDGHVHPVMGLDLTAGIDLTGVRSPRELVQALRTALPTEGWVRGWGLDPNAFQGAPITSAPLVEALGPDVPVYLVLFDAHSALVSPKALELAGIRGPQEFRSGAQIVLGPDATPTGHLLELEAMGLVSRLLPAESGPQRRKRLLGLLQDMAASGLTAVNAMDFEGDSEQLFTALEAEGDLPLRLRFAPFVLPEHGRGRLEHVVQQQRLRGRRWAVEGAKFMIDGTIDGGTAWLDEADTHGGSTAPFWPDPQEYRDAVRYLADRDVPTVTHAIGDAGIRYVLETVAGLRTGPRVPHRIEHIETLPDDLVPRFRQLDVTASMQPTHCTHYTRADGSDNWSERLGKDRAARGFRTRDLREAGARLALGSDWPIAPFDPRAIIADARLRRIAGDPHHEPVGPDQALTARMALEGYTSQAAQAAGLAGRAGAVRPGLRADLSAFALDPLTADPDEFAQSPVPLTIVDGSIVHRG